jgi:tetraacyldisaccharide 4'-kinase
MYRFIFFPFSVLWGTFMYIRRNIYHKLQRVTHDKSAICVGNLCLGGSGKTPHIEYLIRLLEKHHLNIAVLSRGYGRKTKDFRFVDSLCSSQEVGDEPLLLYKKHNSISVAVCNNRIEGLKKLYEKLPETDIVLLDDAYQYLPLKPGLSILLTDYYHSYMRDFIFPVGNLREGRSAAKDADIIIITKSPKVIPTIEERIILNKINPLPHQKVYFSYIEFGEIFPLTQRGKEIQHEGVRIRSVVAVCGIANPYPFLEYVKDNFAERQQLVFSDHHRFTKEDVRKIRNCWERSMQKNCVIITTEKDAVRLVNSELKKEIERLPLFCIPIEVMFHRKHKESFEDQIIKYVDKNKKYS